MSLESVLRDVLDIKGVGSASVVTGDGELVDAVGADDRDLAFVAGLIASSLASSRALAETLGEGAVEQAMIEFDDGPLLLVPLDEEGAGGYVTMIGLTSTGQLGRVRFQLRRLLPRIATELAEAA